MRTGLTDTVTPPPAPTKRARYAFLSLLTVALTVLFAARGHVRCLFFPECNALLSVPAARPWTIPTGALEKSAFRYAHELALPPGMPTPVPFDFKAARIAEGYGRRPVSVQYFEHLCRTENVEVVRKVASDVDGFALLRPRAHMELDAPELNEELYAIEEPTGLGWGGDDNQLGTQGALGLDEYVQPLGGLYRYVEYQDPVLRLHYRVYRNAADEKSPPRGDGNWRPKTGDAIRVPYVVRRGPVDSSTARYAYTWRGVRRPRDRELGIGAGEFLVVDLTTGEVIAAKRTFRLTGTEPRSTNWALATVCPSAAGGVRPLRGFVVSVLHPRLTVNDEFVPAPHLEQYHQFILDRDSDHGN